MTEDIDYSTDVCSGSNLCSKAGRAKVLVSHVAASLAYVDMVVIRVETAESEDNPIIDLSPELMTSDTAGPCLVPQLLLFM